MAPPTASLHLTPPHVLRTRLSLLTLALSLRHRRAPTCRSCSGRCHAYVKALAHNEHLIVRASVLPRLHYTVATSHFSRPLRFRSTLRASFALSRILLFPITRVDAFHHISQPMPNRTIRALLSRNPPALPSLAPSPSRLYSCYSASPTLASLPRHRARAESQLRLGSAQFSSPRMSYRITAQKTLVPGCRFCSSHHEYRIFITR